MRTNLSGAMVILLGLALSSAACLQKDVSERWYVAPDNGVTWTIVERDVRSDADTTADRQREEGDYMAAVHANAHPMANGLRQLGATRVIARLLRAAPPYSVVTEAHFDDIGDLGRRLITENGLVGASVLAPTTDGFTWTLTWDDPRAQGSDDREPDDLAAVMADLDTLHVVLTDGRFTEAIGFDLSGDHRVATLKPLDDPKAPSSSAGGVVWMLHWQTAAAR